MLYCSWNYLFICKMKKVLFRITDITMPRVEYQDWLAKIATLANIINFLLSSNVTLKHLYKQKFNLKWQLQIKCNGKTLHTFICALTRFVCHGLITGENYVFRVKAVNAAGYSQSSLESEAVVVKAAICECPHISSPLFTLPVAFKPYSFPPLHPPSCF